MQIAILAFSAISAVSGVASLVIMAKTKKSLEKFGQDLRGEIDNVKGTTNNALGSLRSALEGVEL